MYLQSAVEAVFNALKSSEALDGCVIIKAFPFVKKPARLRHTVITVSPAQAKLKNTELGGENAVGIFCVSIDIFTPQEQGCPAQNGVTDSIIKAVYPLCPTELYVSDFKGSDELGAFEAKCTASFSDVYTPYEEQGGQSGE